MGSDGPVLNPGVVPIRADKAAPCPGNISMKTDNVPARPRETINAADNIFSQAAGKYHEDEWNSIGTRRSYHQQGELSGVTG